MTNAIKRGRGRPRKTGEQTYLPEQVKKLIDSGKYKEAQDMLASLDKSMPTELTRSERKEAATKKRAKKEKVESVRATPPLPPQQSQPEQKFTGKANIYTPNAKPQIGSVPGKGNAVARSPGVVVPWSPPGPNIYTVRDSQKDAARDDLAYLPDQYTPRRGPAPVVEEFCYNCNQPQVVYVSYIEALHGSSFYCDRCEARRRGGR